MSPDQPRPLHRPLRLAILVNRDRFFLSHFIERALAAREAGYRVFVLSPDTGEAKKIVAAGLEFLPLPMSRHSAGAGSAMRTVWAIARAYRQIRPDVCWQIGLKPLLLGTLAAKWTGGCRLVNAPVGMGFVFSSDSLKARLMRLPMRLGLRALLNPRGSKVVFENPDDLTELLKCRAVRPQDAVVIRGAGVNLKAYAARAESENVPVVLFAARLIWEKGVGEFVSAARLLRARGCRARFQIAGGVDRDSSTAVPEAQLHAWVREGVVEWLGPRNDMPQVLSASNIFCLPSWYREGLPKVILEAMACGRAVVSTDMPGCREAVRHGENGLLVPPKDAHALAEALAILLADPALRHLLGERGRRRAEAEFSSERVCQETLRVFKQIAFRDDQA